jgi:hypothetical protein
MGWRSEAVDVGDWLDRYVSFRYGADRYACSAVQHTARFSEFIIYLTCNTLSARAPSRRGAYFISRPTRTRSSLGA